MNRNDFMKQLEALLQGISSSEREEALQYYNDYFDDAGAENEQKVMEALGSPEKLAENIMRDFYGEGYGEGFEQRYGEHNAQSVSPEDKAVIPYGQRAEQDGTREQETAAAWEMEPVNSIIPEKSTSNKKLSNGMIILIVILCVLASPVIVGIASGLLGTIIGLIAAWFGLIIGFGATALALLVAFVVLEVVGLISIPTDPLVGVALIGAGMLCGGVGILFMMLTVAMAGIVTPAICRGIAGFVRGLFGKR